jgi:hypothetical protein
MQHTTATRAVRRLQALDGHLSSSEAAIDVSPAKGQKIGKIRPRLPLVLLPEVAQALAANRPVVALESTIISHGTADAPPPTTSYNRFPQMLKSIHRASRHALPAKPGDCARCGECGAR